MSFILYYIYNLNYFESKNQIDLKKSNRAPMRQIAGYPFRMASFTTEYQNYLTNENF